MPKYNVNESFLVGQSQTGIVKTNEGVLTGFLISGSVITGSLVTFLVSRDGTNFYPLYNYDSTEVSLTVTTAARAYSLNPNEFMGWDYAKARLGSSASAVLQATYDEGVVFVIDSM